MDNDVLIVGAGLCGLALARDLQAQDKDFLIVEARDRVDGRILRGWRRLQYEASVVLAGPTPYCASYR